MNYKAHITIMPKPELLDPQGKAVLMNLKNINVHNVSKVRIGKHIHVELEAKSIQEAKEKIEIACKKLLSNTIMESYEFHIETL